MSKRIVIIQGHPDSSERHFSHALADAYRRAAEASGREVRTIDVATLDFPVLRSPGDFNAGTLPPALQAAQEAIGWADHLVIVFPLWLGTMPALLKGFFEQVLRPGFALDASRGPWARALKGRSARLIVTMGMPALVFRWYYRAHGVKVLERSILRFCGIAPVRRTLIGMGGGSEARRQRWLRRMTALGRRGA